jgi:hypothetical protein
LKTQNLNVRYSFSIVLILFFIIICTNVTAQDTIRSQKTLLLTRVTEFLDKYQQYGQFTKDGVQLDEKYIYEFSLLFDKYRFKGIYDDLSIEGKTKFNLPDEYISYVRIYYPQGVDQVIDLENISILDSTIKEDYYNIIVRARKHLTGIHGAREIHRIDEDLYFFIKVLVSDLDNISRYKIIGILSREKYSKYFASRKSRGIYLGFTEGYDVTRIFNSTVYSSDIWSNTMVNTFNSTVDLTFMFTNGFGLGLGYSKYEYGTLFTIQDYNETSEAIVTDIDGDKYNPVFQNLNLKENNTIMCYEIPFLIKTRAGKGIVKFNFNFGAVYTMVKESYYTLDGSSTIAGYYPQYYVTLRNIPEYGFGDFKYSPNVVTKMTLTDQLISAHASLGLSFSIGRSFLLKVGGRINYGLTDIGFGKIRHSNDFNNTLAAPISSTTLQSAGVEIGLSYRILRF